MILARAIKLTKLILAQAFCVKELQVFLSHQNNSPSFVKERKISKYYNSIWEKVRVALGIGSGSI